MPNNLLKGTSYYSEGPSYSAGSREYKEVQKMIEAEPSAKNELNDLLKKYGITPIEEEPERQYFQNFQQNEYTAFPLDNFFTGGASVAPPGGQQTAQSTPQTNAEIDTRLQIILNSIPIADPGKIITSEYHNSLRDAVRALASRIGLSVNPVSEFKILSFAPNFLPLTSPNATSGAPTAKWDIFLNRASIPPSAISSQQAVSGGFVVQLPDGAKIFQMIVRGERLDKDAPKPTKFNVRLSRLKFTKEKVPPTVLIDIDLKQLTDGIFEEKGSVKLSNEELDSDTITAQNKIADRKLVNNETHLYYVSAEWLGGMTAGQPNGAKSEIHSIQIYCAV